MKSNGIEGRTVQYRTVAGKRTVMLDEAEYRRLMEKADEWEPALPDRDGNGNYPALEYARVSLARKIIQRRRKVGLSQSQLAQEARIHPKTMRRIEQAETSPSIDTLEKLEKALTALEKK